MKVKRDMLSTFLKKVKMDGTEKIEEAILDFTEQGLKVSALAPSKVNRVDAVLKMSAFEQYEAIGKIGVQGISTIVNILGKFNEDVVIKVEGNLLSLSDKNKSMTTELVDTQFIEAVSPVKELEFDDFFTMQADTMKEIIADASINKEFHLSITTVKKGVKFSNTGKYKFDRNVVVDEATGGVSTTVSKPFVNAVANLTGKLEMNVKNNFPVKILEKTEESVVSIITAPIVN